tara:strand:+ start:755 stop:2353 length:1599 start_codon:yes stop_codon:yes gene_type:complete
MLDSKKIFIYDSTLRDGAQTKGVDFSLSDKIAIAKELDGFGLDYIEGGWPGANNTDTEFFKKSPKLRFSKLVSFGMTNKNPAFLRKKFNEIKKKYKVKTVCIVGKTWDFQVKQALNISESENLKIIKNNIEFATKFFDEVLFDAEHFFDGFISKKDYALKCIKTADTAGARWVVLCDTNGGTLPYQVEEIVKEVSKEVSSNKLGIHCHNDTENAVANTLAAVRSGVKQVQGTFNGLGERCGNANLTSIIPTLILKMGFKTSIAKKKLKDLSRISKFIDERLLRKNNPSLPYVGDSAFAHKGGLHASGIQKHSKTYEHIQPEIVGNKRNIVVSDQSGKSSLSIKLKELGFKVNEKKLNFLIKKMKKKEFDGYSYDGAEASFELFIMRELSKVPNYFKLKSFQVINEYKDLKDNLDANNTAKANVVVKVKKEYFSNSIGNGPVNALDNALRGVLIKSYPILKKMNLVDYKVRILTPDEGTKAITRVVIESSDENKKNWSTVGVSSNVINASYIALKESITYKLIKSKIKSAFEK